MTACHFLRFLPSRAGELVASSRPRLNEILLRVIDQFNVFKSLHQQNPEQVLEYPADKALIDIFKAAKPHVSKTDPVIEVLESVIFEYESKRLNVKVGQLLPVIMSLQGALQNKLDRSNVRSTQRGRSSPSSPGGKSQPRHLNPPSTPSPPQYRLAIVSDRTNGLTHLRSDHLHR